MFLIYEIMFNLFYGPNVRRQRKSWNAKQHAGLQFKIGGKIK